MAKLTAAEISARLADHIEKLAEFLIATAPTSKDKLALRWGSKGSFCIFVAGDRRGRFFDHELGQGGDALDLICRMQRCNIGEGMRWACAWLGLDTDYDPDPHSPPPVAAKPQKPIANDDDVASRIERALKIWHEAKPLDGSLAAVYLLRRGLKLPAPEVLRYHPACPFGTEKHPALIGLMSDPVTAEPTGVHRTALTTAGTKADMPSPKRMLGRAGIIRLSEDESVTTGLGLAEGIETALSILQIGKWSPVWACCSAGAIAKFPVLAGIEALTIFADADPAGMNAANACAERWRIAEREARIIQPREQGDFNDCAKAEVA